VGLFLKEIKKTWTWMKKWKWTRISQFQRTECEESVSSSAPNVKNQSVPAHRMWRTLCYNRAELRLD
jgi:hypothetical protein